MGPDLLQDDIYAPYPLPDDVEFLQGFSLLLVELGNSGDLIYDLSPLGRGHLYYPGHITLHDHVVALWGDTGLSQVILEFAVAAGLATKIVGGHGLALVELYFPGDLHRVQVCGNDPAGVIQTNRHLGEIGVLAILSLVYEIRKLLSPHSPGAGEAEGKERENL